jgi:hypothetical protein
MLVPRRCRPAPRCANGRPPLPMPVPEAGGSPGACRAPRGGQRGWRGAAGSAVRGLTWLLDIGTAVYAEGHEAGREGADHQPTLALDKESRRAAKRANHAPKPMNTPPSKQTPLQAKTEPKPATPRVARAKPPTNPFGAGPISKKERQQAYADTNGVLRQRNKK